MVMGGGRGIDGGSRQELSEGDLFMNQRDRKQNR